MDFKGKSEDINRNRRVKQAAGYGWQEKGILHICYVVCGRGYSLKDSSGCMAVQVKCFEKRSEGESGIR